MQKQAGLAPYRLNMWGPQNSGDSRAVVNENPVVVVGRRGCCMAHVVKRLLLAHGVSPTVYEVGPLADETALIKDLEGGGRGGARCDGGKAMEEEEEKKMALPVLFIGGELVGGLERVMAVHISGELVTKLKEAGAI